MLCIPRIEAIPRLVVPTIVLLSLVLGPVHGEPIRDATFERWSAHRHTRTLTDGSSMSEYAGETESISTAGFRLRIGFVPRFACEPLITIVAAPTDTAAPVTIESVRPVDFQIDGTSLELPVIADQDIGQVRLYYDAPVQRIAALREQIDRSDLAFVRTRDSKAIVFSLFGSQRTLELAESLCRQHPPSEPEAQSVPDPDAG